MRVPDEVTPALPATVLRARFLLDGVSDDPIADPEVVIRGGRIESIAAGRMTGRGSAAGPAADDDPARTFIDLGPRTILPGLIDAHVHLTGTRRGDREFTDRTLSAMRAAADAQAALRSGFTTLRDCGSPYAIGLREAIAEGSMAGPRILACGPMISQTGGHADRHDLPYDLAARYADEFLLADGVDACRLAVRRAIRAGADWIKICATGGNTSLRGGHHDAQFTAGELETLVEEAHRLGRRVAAHATGREGVLAAVRAGVDSIEHGYFIDQECVDEMLARHTWLVPTFSLSRYFADPADGATLPASRLAKQRQALEGMEQSFPLAYRSGVRMATGTDCGGGPGMELGTSVRELEAQVDAGVRPIDAIRFATSEAADLLGLSAETGRLAPGLTADLVAVEGEPWADVAVLRAIDFVMRAGAVAVGPNHL